MSFAAPCEDFLPRSTKHERMRAWQCERQVRRRAVPLQWAPLARGKPPVPWRVPLDESLVPHSLQKPCSNLKVTNASAAPGRGSRTRAHPRPPCASARWAVSHRTLAPAPPLPRPCCATTDLPPGHVSKQNRIAIWKVKNNRSTCCMPPHKRAGPQSPHKPSAGCTLHFVACSQQSHGF